MDVAEWVAIAIALLGVASGIWRQVLQFKKEINSTIEGVAELLEAKRIHDAIKQRISQAVESPLYIESAVKSIYEKNASLQTMVNELTEANNVLEHENNVLRKQNQDLQNEVQKLKKELQPDRGGRSNR